MNFDKYDEVINGEETYKEIANVLKRHKSIGIGWTDEHYTHLDIIFTLGVVKKGCFQRGIQANDLFVSIIGHTSYGFKTDSLKFSGYIQEKLRMNNECGDKLSELINGIIVFLNEEVK